MKIVISIVSHNQKELVDRLLRSIDKYLSVFHNELIILITNNLPTADHFNCKYPILVTDNLDVKGFGANHNAAFERENPDLFLIVNPDIELISEFNLDNLVIDMLNKKISVTSPVIVNSYGALEDYKRQNLTILTLIKRYFIKGYKESFDWYAGMFLIILGRSFRDLSGFDTRFFMYVEDCDLCMRARNLGQLVEDCVPVEIKHNAQRSSRKNFSVMVWHITSLFKYLLKR